MPLPQAIKKRTFALNKRFDKCLAKLERLEAAERYDQYDAFREQELDVIYKEACGLVRDADEADAPYCNELLDTVQNIIDEAEGETGDMYLGHITRQTQDSDDGEDLVVVVDQGPRFGRADDPPQPHPRSNPFATFRPNLPELTTNPDDRFATTVYDARCEITSVRDITQRFGGHKEADSVIDLQLSADGTCLAVLGSIKKKNHYHHPWLACHYPDDTSSRFTDLMSFKNPARFEVGLAGVPTHMAMGETQPLILVGDKKRIKSFAWATADGVYYKKPLAQHTMDSTGFGGPILLLPNGKVLRAGQGKSAVWATSRIPNHRSRGRAIIGDDLEIDDEYDDERDENPYIESSSGSPPTSQITFANKPKLQPTIWKLLPSSPSIALCAERMHGNFIAMDLEYGGKTTARYKGHDSLVTHISTSVADSQVFLTSSDGDGYARLFDVRHPEPVLALKCGREGGGGHPVALAHPDGIPTAFTDSGSPQDFKVWDLRARACVYELGTLYEYESFGHSLAWDSGRNTLYSWRSVFEDSDSDYYESGGECDEPTSFSRIYRYAFKERPTYSMLPPDDPEADEAEYFEFPKEFSTIQGISPMLGSPVTVSATNHHATPKSRSKTNDRELATIYKNACALVRGADNNNAPYRADLLDTLQPIIDEAIVEDGVVDVGCLTLRAQDYRDEPIVIKDRRVIQTTAAAGNGDDPEDPKPHPRSNPYALFSFNPTSLTAKPTDRIAMPIYDARCEISSVRDQRGRHFERCETDQVVGMQISSGGSCLAVLGWVETKVLHPRNCRRTGKFTAPWISYHLPGDPKSKFTKLMQWPGGHRSQIGLAGVPCHIALDESQRLIFAADNDRIKSFEWAAANGSFHKYPVATHTLQSKQFSGPMATLPNGTLIRAGTGAAATWNLSQLKTHGPKGNQVIGKEIFIDDECEYDSDCDNMPDFEYSSGSGYTSKITFTDDRKLDPKVWRVLPHSSSTVLAVGRMERSCIAIDLEHGGKTIARYQGHSSYVSDVSVSIADPRVFLTSSGDGYARLFDVRRPKAVLQFEACRAGKECGAVALAHPDGIPTIFTASRYEDFTVWDLRSRVCVYELGADDHDNSSVCSFAWDSEHNSLYSLKSCFDENGGYSDDSDDEEGSSYSRIYRYSFKVKPRYAMLPSDDPKVDEEEYFEEEYDTEVPMDDSDEDYVD
ncbi:WD domain, G-beta repeat protein [Rhizoctonia solani 123E]|uniref:WD domain, G-beta repeat protein n=1 Tax=Rhizoctonia solani 123E TaxID=1423351 RepID=A0A074SEB3_9AGAM|nr:WD domain, G-beta repeat protein [Rhizoctonia solani 123E]